MSWSRNHLHDVSSQRAEIFVITDFNAIKCPALPRLIRLPRSFHLDNVYNDNAIYCIEL
jgi:hypothetical protein